MRTKRINGNRTIRGGEAMLIDMDAVRIPQIEGHRIKQIAANRWRVSYVLYQDGIYIADGVIVNEVTDEAKAIAKELVMKVWRMMEFQWDLEKDYLLGMLDTGELVETKQTWEIIKDINETYYGN